jgi:hypothetical protein
MRQIYLFFHCEELEKVKTSIVLSEQRKAIAVNDIETSGKRRIKYGHIQVSATVEKNKFSGPILGTTNTA